MIKLIFESKILRYSGILLLVFLLTSAYILSRPDAFVKTSATITKIELLSMRRMPYYFEVSYEYNFNLKKYSYSDNHFLPYGIHPYSTKYEDSIEAKEYIENWKKSHDVGMDLQILVNSWYPRWSSSARTADDWFVDLSATAVFLWVFIMLFFVSIFILLKNIQRKYFK